MVVRGLLVKGVNKKCQVTAVGGSDSICILRLLLISEGLRSAEDALTAERDWPDDTANLTQCTCVCVTCS